MAEFNSPWTTSLKLGEIFLFPIDYFNDHLDKNPAYISIELRSLIGYWPEGKVAVIVFNNADKTMLTLLGGNSIQHKKNNLRFVKSNNSRQCEKYQLIEWACGTFTPYHRVFAELSTPAKHKVCLPRYGKTAKFYSLRKSKFTLNQIHGDIRFMPYWRNELSDTYEYINIKTVMEKTIRRLYYETGNQS
jgi:hypothetical protein